MPSSNAAPLALLPPSTPEHQAILLQRRSELRARLADTLPQPQTRVVWEIGCGHGHFLAAYAKAHPAETCIGVDIESARIDRAQKKRDRAALQNLHFIRAEARLFLEEVPAQTAFLKVFVLFPDPWPKLRHHKHRLIQPDFLRALSKRMAGDGRLYFRTDYQPYFDGTSAALSAENGWHIKDERWPFECETVFQARAKQYWSIVAGSRWPAS